MDVEAFGTLPADRLTIATPRRRVLRALGGLALGAAGVALTHDAAAARRRRRRTRNSSDTVIISSSTGIIAGNLGICGPTGAGGTSVEGGAGGAGGTADCDFNDQF